jgi:hypothetical protein
VTCELTVAVFSAFDMLKAGTKVEVALGAYGSRDFVDVYTSRCCVRSVATSKLRAVRPGAQT